MKHPLANLRTPRGSFVIILAATIAISGWLGAPVGHSQAPSASTPNASLDALLFKLKTQQDALAANQTKIEAQTALLKENLRQAKIYAGRGGSGHR